MQYLYIDNFRGFSDTIIPITDVTFLVGENSTGKTSVLGLLNLLNSSQFWFSPRFDTEEVKLGHFKDIVSIHSSDRTYFTVGIIEDKEDNGRWTSRAFLLTFKEKSGLPSLSHVTVNTGDRAISIRLSPKTISRKFIAIDSHVDGKTFLSTTLRQWRKEHSSSLNGYVRARLPWEMAEVAGPENFAIPILVNFAATLGQDNKKLSNKEKVLGLSLGTSLYRDSLVWLAPIRTTPKRTYDKMQLDFSPEGSHTPYLVRKILSSKSAAAEFRRRLEKIGEQSGLFESIKIQKYGSSPAAPFELDIVIDQKALNISTVGYGVSQAFPVIIELLYRGESTLFAIQQPEVHLHPKAQAALGGLFFELFVQEKKRFLIETHSDFLIDRFRMSYKKSSAQPNAQILFFERKKKHNTATPIPILRNGDLSEKQPDNYRKFFIHEEMKMLGL